MASPVAWLFRRLLFILGPPTPHQPIYRGFVTFAWKKYFLQHDESVIASVSARCCPNNTVNTVPRAKHFVNTVIFGLQGTKTIPKASKNGQTLPHWRLLGPCAHHRHHQQQQRQQAFELWFFCFFFLRCWRGDAFYTERLLQTDDVTHSSLCTEQLFCAHALTQRGLCREKPLHTDASTHRGFHAKKLLHIETFTHPCFAQRCSCTAQHLRTDAFTHSLFYTQTLAFTRRSFYTEKPLHRTSFTKRSFPPLAKTGKQVFEIGFIRFLSFPSRIMNANWWH